MITRIATSPEECDGDSEDSEDRCSVSTSSGFSVPWVPASSGTDGSQASAKEWFLKYAFEERAPQALPRVYLDTGSAVRLTQPRGLQRLQLKAWLSLARASFAVAMRLNCFRWHSIGDSPVLDFIFPCPTVIMARHSIPTMVAQLHLSDRDPGLRITFRKYEESVDGELCLAARKKIPTMCLGDALRGCFKSGEFYLSKRTADHILDRAESRGGATVRTELHPMLASRKKEALARLLANNAIDTMWHIDCTNHKVSQSVVVAWDSTGYSRGGIAFTCDPTGRNFVARTYLDAQMVAVNLLVHHHDMISGADKVLFA